MQSNSKQKSASVQKAEHGARQEVQCSEIRNEQTNTHTVEGIKEVKGRSGKLDI